MGYLIIMLFLPISEGKAVALIALLMFGAGLCLYTQYPPLGIFVTAGSVALFVKEAIEREANNRRIRQMRDAQIDMRYLSRQFRR